MKTTYGRFLESDVTLLLTTINVSKHFIIEFEYLSFKPVHLHLISAFSYHWDFGIEATRDSVYYCLGARTVNRQAVVDEVPAKNGSKCKAARALIFRTLQIYKI